MNDLERLRAFVSRYKYKKDAALALGITQAALSQYLHGAVEIGATMRERLSESDANIASQVKENANSYGKVQILEDSEIAWIPYFERRANAGIGIDLSNAS